MATYLMLDHVHYRRVGISIRKVFSSCLKMPNTVCVVGESGIHRFLRETLNATEIGSSWTLKLDTKYYTCNLAINTNSTMPSIVNTEAIILIPTSKNFQFDDYNAEIQLVLDLDNEFPELEDKCLDFNFEYVTSKDRILEALESHLWPDIERKTDSCTTLFGNDLFDGVLQSDDEDSLKGFDDALLKISQIKGTYTL